MTSWLGAATAPVGNPVPPGAARLIPEALVRSRASAALRRLHTAAVPGTTALVLLALAASLPWLDAGLGASEPARELPLRLDSWPTAAGATYGQLVLVAIAAGLLGLLVRGQAGLWWLRAAGGLSVAVPSAFVLLTRTSDGLLQMRLQAERADADVVLRSLPYAVPRPRVTTILAVPVDSTSSLLASSLRAGWLACLAGGLLLLLAAGRRRRDLLAAEHVAVDASRSPAWGALRRFLSAVLAVAAALVAASACRGLIAQREAGQAARLAAVGRPAEAVARYEDALSVNPLLAFDKGVALGRGAALLALGRSDLPEARLAQSRLDMARGDDRRAVDDLRSGLRTRPSDPLLLDELRRAAMVSATVRGAPDVASAVALGGPGSDTAVAWTAARLRFRAGDYDAAGRAFEDVARATSDDAVRSACLTYLAVAQLRTGQAELARASLRAALRADPGHDNVVARSLATGLYSAVAL